MLFIKNIKRSIRFNPLSAQAGKPVPPDSLDRLMEYWCKDTVARGSILPHFMVKFNLEPAENFPIPTI
jgi:hypothetical protein